MLIYCINHLVIRRHV